ncbi:MAG: 23S rRNA (pseudouridine(1915)-N(3))-methyltransferase RlmH [Clostridia bacterium]|jgi:23S rRNA (pseudouridine1915-N3)-methyltransferase|nr:23S rRNA (pseudouridine(1915)-N(3))-methyltransferase RlmH [Clostridia bacterium]
MNINVICVGKIKEKYFSDAISEYSKRLSRFVKLNIIEVADEKIPDNASEKEMEIVKNKEGERILSKLPANSFAVTLCVEGKELSSTELAAKISDVSMTSSNITFIIGGSLGLSDDVKAASHLRLSFGRITLPHQLIRVVLLEQLYRAFKINNNETYHK